MENEIQKLVRDKVVYSALGGWSIPAIISLTVASQGNFSVFVVVIIAWVLINTATTCIYIYWFSKRETGLASGSYIPTYPTIRPYALGILIAITLFTLFIFILPPSREYVAQAFQKPVTLTSTHTPSPTVTNISTIVTISPPTSTPALIRTSLCGESQIITEQPIDRLYRSQGVFSFKVENSPKNTVLNNRVRALLVDQTGIWIGYFATQQNPINGLGHFDKTNWINCNQSSDSAGRNIQAIAVDQANRLWAATEEGGVIMFDGQRWTNFTTQNGLPSNKTYGLTIDQNNDVWVATWEGVARFDSKSNTWKVPYTAEGKTISNNRVHSIVFDSSGNIWIGHIGQGVSKFDNATGSWIYHTAGEKSLSGNQIRSIVVRKADSLSPESVWFATTDGGVSKYQDNSWTSYRIKDGLPSDDVRMIAIDKYNRIWVATSKGTSYFNGTKWVVYTTLDTLSITFGANCTNCPFDNDHIWTGTASQGITRSRVPPPNAVDLIDVCFESVGRGRKCIGSQNVKGDYFVKANYLEYVAPREKIRVEVIVAPRAPYKLLESRGDLFAYAEDDEKNRYSSFLHIPVKGSVDSGQQYALTDFDSPFVAPDLPSGENEKTVTSTWRLWMNGTYVGPFIQFSFTVKRP